ncbi:zinc finger and SCAN domain-containing protein 31 isoform X1 [Drosophila takahashii]|uniref:zinc finger and SCAN domain-containing protein 31 isoform X1 n=2 Tax=Drosophila takahashii TaxID=29030 RepID=UPI001CF887E2|nr:zinc finger protein 665 [Drosophila takahashii]
MFTAAFTDLARLCRICLRHLREREKEMQVRLPDSRLFAILQRFLDINLPQEPPGWPTEICNLCHNAVLCLEELRQVARESGQKLSEWQTPAMIPLDRVKEEPLEEVNQENSQEMALEQEKREESLQEEEKPGEDQEETLEEEQQPPGGHSSKRRAGLACDQCGKQVYKLPYLEAHIRSVHQGYTKPFLCRSCDKCFTRYEQLRSHMRNAHPQLEQLQQELRDLICELCNRQYSTKNALGEHLKRHAQRKEHVCEHCGVAKVTRTELLTHLRTHNPTWERFKCEQCPQLFRHKSAISRHVRVVHEGQRRFQCGHCEKKFGTHASQVRHERLHAETAAAGGGGEPCVSLETLELHLRRHRKRREKEDSDSDSDSDSNSDSESLEDRRKRLRKRQKERQQDQGCQEEQEEHLKQEEEHPEWQHKLEEDGEAQEEPFHDYKMSTSEAL